MGIVNVTPDSFSDGGRFFAADSALRQVDALIADGADIIDLGAESSRPNAEALPFEEEWRRLEAILKALDSYSIPISVDTYKPEAMRRLLDHRVAIMNDIRGGAQMPDVLLSQWAHDGRIYLPMHMHRNPQSMQVSPLNRGEARDAIRVFYETTTARLNALGFISDKIWLDPGIGFGKNDQANLYLIQDALQRAAAMAIALGISRKSFIGRLLDIETPSDRDGATKMLELSFLHAGVKVIRTHNVKHLRRLKDLVAP